MRTALGRLKVLPFEALLAALALQAGLIGLFRVGSSSNVLDAALGVTLAHVFQAGYAVSGLLILVGIGLTRSDAEGSGLILLATSILVRTIAAAYLVGFSADIVTSVFTTAAVLLCCAARLHSVFRHEAIVMLDPPKPEGSE